MNTVVLVLVLSLMVTVGSVIGSSKHYPGHGFTWGKGPGHYRKYKRSAVGYGHGGGHWGHGGHGGYGGHGGFGKGFPKYG